MDYDLAIIGAGPAGFAASLRAKELGLKVALLEKGYIGGTCLNQGCIPTKALIHSAKAKLNFIQAQERKEKIVAGLRQGMSSKLAGIDFLNTAAQIISPEEIKTPTQTLKTKFILISSGSRPWELPKIKFDHQKILSSDDILNTREIPKSLLIIGGGVIGCEFASLFSRLGAKVSIVEKMPQLLPGEDRAIARKLEGLYKKKGILVNTNSDATTIDLSGYDLVLVSIGRQPVTDGLGLDKIGLNIEKSRIVVDDYLKTNIPNIYAAGDCTGKIMLAHYASYQGIIAVNNLVNTSLAGKAKDKNIPNCIFTDPEIASVGINEEKARLEGLDIGVYKFDFLASGMARIMDEAEGFIKIITNRQTDQLLGASIVGPRATELIAVFTLAISANLKASEIRDTVFAHPTLSESISEALKT